MPPLTAFEHDDSGKIDLSAIYDRPDPRGYYQTLAALDYCIPGEAAAIFRRTIATLKQSRGLQKLGIADIGCSYGINAAILKHGRTLEDLCRTYSAPQSGKLSRRELIARDRGLHRARGADELTVIGVDVATRAAGYACQAGIADGAVVTDLEVYPPTSGEALLLAKTDLVISTGAIGYVGAPTFARVLDASERQPWLALFALRMFPIDGIAEALAERGYTVFKLAEKTFRQRRFADPTEATEVLAGLATLGIDPSGREADGWLHAEFYFARPALEAADAPVAGLVPV